MKNKILTFIIGVLVGAIIATVGFYFYSKNNNSKSGGMPDGNPPQMMQDGNSKGMPSGTPPEKPDGENSDGNGGPSKKQNNTQKDTKTSNENDNTDTESNT